MHSAAGKYLCTRSQLSPNISLACHLQFIKSEISICQLKINTIKSFSKGGTNHPLSSPHKSNQTDIYFQIIYLFHTSESTS